MTANNYATVSDIKSALPDGNWDTSYDALLTVLAQRASRAIDRETKAWNGYWYVTTDTTRLYNGTGRRIQPVDELAADPTLVEVDEQMTGTFNRWDAGQFVCYPYNALQNGEPYTDLVCHPYKLKVIWYAGFQNVRVTGKFGYATAIPDEIAQLTIIQAARWFKRGQQGYADTGAIVDLGQLKYTRALDPDVAEMCQHLKRVGLP